MWYCYYTAGLPHFQIRCQAHEGEFTYWTPEMRPPHKDPTSPEVLNKDSSLVGQLLMLPLSMKVIGGPDYQALHVYSSDIGRVFPRVLLNLL